MAENESQEKKEYRKGLLGGCIFAIMLFLAIFADFIVPYEWERGAEALPDNGPTSASGKVIEGETNLVPVFGPKAQSHEDGTFIYPENSDPDPVSEWLFFGVGGINDWAQYNIGGPAYPGDVLNNDKTILNGTDFDISDYVPEYFEDGRFLTPYYFHTFIRVVNKTALLQWDMWFTHLTDMAIIKVRPFDPSGLGVAKPVKQYPIIAYATGQQDTERQGGDQTRFSFINPEYQDPEAKTPIESGVNRVVLQVVSIQRDFIGVDVDWSDMVYRVTDLTPENVAQLEDTFGRDTSGPAPAAGEPYPLVLESTLKVGEFYGLNASGEVRYYAAGEDPDFPEDATYRMPVRQAMWRAEVGEGLTAQPVQRKRGWSFRIFNPTEIPEVRYGLPPWSDSQAGVGHKLLGLPFVADYILGTDLLGHDILTGLILGARVSLFIGFLAIFISTTIGVTLGAVSGYYAGLVDEFFMRFTDVIISIPSFFLLLLALSVFQDSIRDLGAYGGPTVIALILGFLGWAGTARIVRAEFLALRGLEYAEAARVLGASDRRIIFRHLLPNAMAPVIVNATIGIAFVILTEAGIAFLGLGNPQTPSWGRMLQLAQAGMRFAWWAAIIPGLAIFVAVLAFNMLGDALRDALDPRLKE
jgi:peptide/nickel transport system permease protein